MSPGTAQCPLGAAPAESRGPGEVESWSSGSGYPDEAQERGTAFRPWAPPARRLGTLGTRKGGVPRGLQEEAERVPT